MGRKSKRSIAAKKSRRPWAVEPATVTKGQVLRELRCVHPEACANRDCLDADCPNCLNPEARKERRAGKRVGLWEDIKTGEPKRIINSDVVSGKTVSAGRIQKENFKKHLAKQAAEAEQLNIEDLPPRLVEEARRLPGVDGKTGTPIKT